MILLGNGLKAGIEFILLEMLSWGASADGLLETRVLAGRFLLSRSLAAFAEAARSAEAILPSLLGRRSSPLCTRRSRALKSKSKGSMPVMLLNSALAWATDLGSTFPTSGSNSGAMLVKFDPAGERFLALVPFAPKNFRRPGFKLSTKRCTLLAVFCEQNILWGLP